MADLQCVEFYGDTISTCKNEETGKVYCIPREITERLGIDYASQWRKLKDEPYQEHTTRCDMTTSQGDVEMLLLDIEMLPTWLLSIQVRRVKEEVRAKLRAYQQECAQALSDYWTKGAAFNPRVKEEEPEQFWQLCETKKKFKPKFQGKIASHLNALKDANRRGVPKLPTDMGSDGANGTVPHKLHAVYLGTMGPKVYAEAKARKAQQKAVAVHQVIDDMTLDMQRGLLLGLGIAARSEEEYQDMLAVALGNTQLTMAHRWRNSELLPGETRTEKGPTLC